jgi:2-dehydropantoate 2-reductase
LPFVKNHRTSPGSVQQCADGPLYIGLHNFNDQSIFNELKELLRQYRVEIEFDYDLMTLRWSKLFLDMPLNSLTVLLDTTAKSLIEGRESMDLLQGLMVDVIYGAHSCGIQIPLSLSHDLIRFIQKSGPCINNMKFAFDHGRPLEFYYNFDYPIMQAQKHGYFMEKVHKLAQQLRVLEKSRPIHL